MTGVAAPLALGASLISVAIALYLLLCVFLGGPFIAFDHRNYINFLDDPYPWFFEPGYTTIAYLIHEGTDPSLRFPLMFCVGMVPPLLLTAVLTRSLPCGSRAVVAFAAVLIKSFVVGFIAQRFFFAELYSVPLFILAIDRPQIRTVSLLTPGIIWHFSALSFAGGFYWLTTKPSRQKLLYGFVVVALSALVSRWILGFRLFGYDYSRYLDPANGAGSLTMLPFLELASIWLICKISTGAEQAANIGGLIAVVAVAKLFFADVEVVSRLIQFQVDIIIVWIVLVAIRVPYAALAFSGSFAVAQLLLSKTSVEVLAYHVAAVSNVLSAARNW